MPILSEAGTGRGRTVKFEYDYETVGAKMLSQLHGVNRNMKLNLVSEMFFHKEDPTYNFKDSNWHQRYQEPSYLDDSMERRAIDLLKVSETKEVFGLTYGDLMEMSKDTFEYVSKLIVDMANEHINKQKELDKENNRK